MCGEIDIDAAPLHQRDRGLQHRERLEAEEVEFHQPRLLHPFHVELGDRHVRLRIAVERHQFRQRAVADDDAGGVGRGVAGEAFELLRDVEGALDHRIVVGFGLQLRLVLDGVRQRHRRAGFCGTSLQSLSTWPYGICSTRPTSRSTPRACNVPKVMICATWSRP